MFLIKKSSQPLPAVRTQRGFTLIEVMISIALVLIIILGVNQVFGITSRAVGSGQALSEITRNARSAQSILYSDFAAAEIDRAPFFLIRSTTMAAMRNQEARLRDLDYLPTDFNLDLIDRRIRTIDRNGNGNETDANDLTPRIALTSVTHRQDLVAFFTRSTARRQTGDKTKFISSSGSDEQYVIYTHLRQPALLTTAGETTEGRDPGFTQYSTGNYTTYTEIPQTTFNNPYNFYATQWVLGRKAMILRDAPSNRILVDSAGNPMWYFGRGASAAATSRAPFSGNSNSVDTTGKTSSETVQNSFYDVAGMSMESYRQLLPSILTALKTAAPNTYSNTWADPLIYRPTGFTAPNRPLTPTGVARTVPCMLPHCTQFVVEYAGDFVSQDATGKVLGYAGQTVVAGGPPTTDGEIDFCVEKITGTRKIRWYGFPRDTDGDGHVFTNNANGIGSVTDVLPARDVVRSSFPTFAGFLFEKDMAAKFKSVTPNDYSVEGILTRRAPGNSGFPTSYVCCWSTETSALPRPKLIRITLALDDPAGRVPNEQFFEYIVELP